ncbi:MAG: hypothetical protein NVS2B15_02290 [Pseudarthrobacter sp.]
MDAATPHMAAMSWMVAGRSVPAVCIAMAFLSERDNTGTVTITTALMLLDCHKMSTFGNRLSWIQTGV